MTTLQPFEYRAADGSQIGYTAEGVFYLRDPNGVPMTAELDHDEALQLAIWITHDTALVISLLPTHAGGREVHVTDMVSGRRLAPITFDALDRNNVTTAAYN